MWHASVAARPGLRIPAKTLERFARKALAGVGDRTQEWVDHPGHRGASIAVHLRRRLTAAEMVCTGPVVDIRADRAEVARRLAPVRHRLPPGYTE